MRFANLGALEISPDEATSWAAASAPSVAEVSARHYALNPGELPIYDLTLHGWIALFGTSPTAMRALSAAFGVLTIALVYIVVCELFAPAPEPETESALTIDDIASIAGLAAIVFAVNLVTIKYSREARMYPMLLAVILAQVAIFLRTLRTGGRENYALVVVLTAIVIATNYSALAVPAVEGLWLLYVLARAGWRLENATARRAWALAAALAVGGLILVPKLLSPLRVPTTATGVARGWRKLPGLAAPFAFFNKATGSFAFPILAALAIWGAIPRMAPRRARRCRLRAAVDVGAALLMLVASYTIAPVFVERYALSSFVPFFILVALGIFELPGDLIRAGALVLAVAFSLGHLVAYDRKPHDAQFREAITAASSALKPGEVMTIVPSYAIELIRYYLPPGQPLRAVRYDPSAAPVAVLILGDQNLEPGAGPSYKKDYPNVVARLRGVTVLRR